VPQADQGLSIAGVELEESPVEGVLQVTDIKEMIYIETVRSDV
jgi:hypothetical protein